MWYSHVLIHLDSYYIENRSQMTDRRSFSFPDPGLLDAITEAANEQRRSRSEYVRSILAEAVGYEEPYVPRSKLQAAPDSR